MADEVQAAGVFELRAEGGDFRAEIADLTEVAKRFERATVDAFQRAGKAASDTAALEASSKRYVSAIEREALATERKTAALVLSGAEMRNAEAAGRGETANAAAAIGRLEAAEAAYKSLAAQMQQMRDINVFGEMLSKYQALGQVEKNIDSLTAALDRLQSEAREAGALQLSVARVNEDRTREAADSAAFGMRVAKAQELARAADYVQFWGSALDMMEAKERELAAVPLFEKEKAAADKLRRTADATAAFTQLLDQLEAQEKKLAGDNAFVEALQRRSNAIGKTQADLLELEAAERGVSAQAAPFIDNLRAQEHALGVYSGGMRDARVSANQLKTGLAQLPMQFTDIFTSLAGGQNPLLVFIQQGGQIKDSFGGVGNALRAVASVITPMAMAIGGAAAAVGSLGLAYKQGSEEVDFYRAALVLTGNAAGATIGQLNAMAIAVSANVGTQAKAAETLAALAATGRVAAADLGKLAEAAIRLEREGGPAVKETVKAFADLAKDPSKAVVKLNEDTNFLTLSLYKQIKALDEQGKTAQAASLAQTAYADAVNARAKTLEGGLGTMEKAWRGVSETAKSAWDAMLGVGRQDTADESLAKVRQRIAQLQGRLSGGRLGASNATDMLAGDDVIRQQLEAMQETERVLKRSITTQGQAASSQAALAAETKKGIKALDDQYKAAEKAAEAFKKLAEAGKDLVFGGLAKANGFDPKLGDQIEKIAAAYKLGSITADQMHQAMTRVMDAQPYLVERTKAEEKALEELDKAIEDVTKSRLKALEASEKENDAAAKRVDSLRKETDALRDRLAEELGGKAGKADNEALRKAAELRTATANATATASDGNEELARQLWAQVDELKAQLAELNKISAAVRGNEESKEAGKAAKAWEESAKDIRTSLVDAFRTAYQSGEDFGSAMAKTIGNELKARLSTAVAEGLADLVIGFGGYALTAMRGSSSSAVSSGASSLWDMYSTGNKAYSAYSGSTTAQQFIAGYQGSSASMGAGTVGPVTDGAVGATGSGASASSAMSTIGPYAIAAAIYAIGADQMAEWSLSFGARSLASRNGVQNTTAGQPGLQGLDAETIAGMAEQGVRIADPQALTDGLATALFSFGEKFAASVGAKSAIEAAQVLLESDSANPSWGEVKFLGAGGAEIGASGMQTDLSWNAEIAAPQLVTRSAGAFAQAMQGSDAPDWVKTSLGAIPAELERITPDITKQFEDPLQQAQAVNQALAGMLDGISNTFKQLDGLDEQFGVLGGAFGQLADMSSDARNSLVQAVGGMDQFQKQTASYVANFYTDGEKTALTLDAVGRELGKVGLTLPTTRDGFRDLVDAQDLSSEAGRKAYATLMGTADAFASVTTASRDAADIANERAGLEQQLLELQGNTVKLRELERNKLDESNRALFDQVQALTAQTEAAQEAREFNDALRASFVDLGGVAESLVRSVAESTGGASGLAGLLTDYFAEFYSETERGAIQAKNLSTALRDVGVQVPDTVAGLQSLGRDGFRALVTAAVGSGNSAAVGALLQVSGAFTDLVPSAEDAAESMQKLVDAMTDAVTDAMSVLERTVKRQKDAVTAAYDEAKAAIDAREVIAKAAYTARLRALDAERDALGDGGTGAVRDQIDAEQDSERARRRAMASQLEEVEARIETAAEAFKAAMSAVADNIKITADDVSRLSGLSSALRSTIDGMRPMGAAAFDRMQAQAQIRDALATARATGELPAAEDLRRALSEVSKPSESLFSTQVDYLRDFNKTLNDVTALSDITDGQLDIAQQQLTALESIRDLMERSQFAKGPEADTLRADLNKALSDYAKANGEQFNDIADVFAGFPLAVETALRDSLREQNDAASTASDLLIEGLQEQLDGLKAAFDARVEDIADRRTAVEDTQIGVIAAIDAQRDALKLAYDAQIGRLDKIIEDNQALVDAALGTNKIAGSIEEAVSQLKDKLSALESLSTIPAALGGVATALAGLPANIASAVAAALAGITFNTPAAPTTTTAAPVQPTLPLVQGTPIVTNTGGAVTTQQGGSYGPDGVWYPGGYNWAATDHTRATGTTPVATDPSGLGDTLRGYLAAEQYDLFRSTAMASATANTLAKAAQVTGYFPAYLQSLVDQGKFAAFADGGLHAGGMRLVGERGPELEVTGPARYYSTDQTMEMLGNPSRGNDVLVAEVRRLNEKIAQLESVLVATAANTGRTARQLDRWDGEGLPTERT